MAMRDVSKCRWGLIFPHNVRTGSPEAKSHAPNRRGAVPARQRKTANNSEPGIPALVPEEIQNTPPDARLSAHFPVIYYIFAMGPLSFTESLRIQTGVDECAGFS
jgi:hypothetical protein